MLNQLIKKAYNLFGWHTDRKIIVIESDDWGSIKMPSRKTYDDLVKKGYQVDKDLYSKYDCLESNADLESLFEVLNSVKDKNGSAAVITANVVIANPDFERIRQDRFELYHYEVVPETFRKYPQHDRAFSLWKEGFKNGIFIPQYHGREHLNVDRWIIDLQKGNQHLREAFDLQMVSFSFLPSYMRFGYMEGLDFFSEAEKQTKSEILEDGHMQFFQLMGYNSKTFIANCYIWHPDFEQTLAGLGIQSIQSNVFQLIPWNKGAEHKLRRKIHFTGQKNSSGQIYTVRNAHFEPSHGIQNDPVAECLAKIQEAFNNNKPAIISSHRLNFMSGVCQNNRDKNLKKFQLLLDSIVKIWPEVEFMSSATLSDTIQHS